MSILSRLGILSSLQPRIGVDAENETIDENECTCMPQCSDKWYSLASQTADIKGIVYDEPISYVFLLS